MRILHVINSLATGGAERLVSDLLPRLVARGFEVELLVLDARGDVFSSHLEAAGVDVRFARKAGASPYSPFRILDISRAVAGFKPDIVHAHLGPSFHWVALVPCKAIRIERSMPLKIAAWQSPNCVSWKRHAIGDMPRWLA